MTREERREVRKLKEELELMKEGNMHLRRVIRSFIGERDQARKLAREMFPFYTLMQEWTAEALVKRHPWLEERDG